MNIERITSCAIALSALVIAGTVVHREIRASAATSDRSSSIEYLPQWPGIMSMGIPIGDTSSAKVIIVEFADFQCPVCGQLEPTLRSLESRYEGALARVIVHWPLDSHVHARAAARAAECAHEQNRFAAMTATLYAGQKAFGSEPWMAFARRAGVPDLDAFQRCVESDSAVVRIDQGVALAQSLKLRGTPTLVINGWRFAGAPPESVLVKTVEDLLANRRPEAAR